MSGREVGVHDAEPRPLVLGATSLVGRFLLPRLAAAGARPWALSRTPAAGPDWIAADLTQPNLAERLPWSAQVYATSPVWLLTPAALHALADAGMTRLVAFSSTSVQTKAASSSAYERGVVAWLRAGEAAVAEACGARGVAWTVLRPTLIYAEGLDGNVSRLAGLVRRFGVLPLAGRGAGLRQPVHADDLAAGAMAAMASPAAEGRAFAVPGGESLTYRAMTERIFAGLGRRPRIVPVPAPLWTMALTLAGPLLPGATGAMGARMDRDMTFDPAPAWDAFGWTARGFHPAFPHGPASAPKTQKHRGFRQRRERSRRPG